MTYTQIEIAEQFADEISVVQAMMEGAPKDQAYLLAQVVAHLQALLDALIDGIDAGELAMQPWWQRLRPSDANGPEL